MANVEKLFKQAYYVLKIAAPPAAGNDNLESPQMQKMLAPTVGIEIDAYSDQVGTTPDMSSQIVKDISAKLKVGSQFLGNIEIGADKSVKFYADNEKDPVTAGIIAMLNQTWAPKCVAILKSTPKVPAQPFYWKQWMNLSK